MFMVAIFYIFLEHCVTCCSKIISCGKFSLNIWNRFFIRGIREQQFVLLYKLRFSKIHKLTLCVKKNSIWTLCMKFLSRSHVKRCFFYCNLSWKKKLCTGIDIRHAPPPIMLYYYFYTGIFSSSSKFEKIHIF